MKNPSELSDEELKQEFKSYHNLVENLECFGVDDVRYYHGLSRELEKRGMEVHVSVEVVE